jgi:hypothetical protein
MGDHHDDAVRTAGVPEHERTPGPEHEPQGDLGGHPVNADETSPGEVMPHPGGRTGSPEPDRHPGSVEDEPGEDL